MYGKGGSMLGRTLRARSLWVGDQNVNTATKSPLTNWVGGLYKQQSYVAYEKVIQ